MSGRCSICSLPPDARRLPGLVGGCGKCWPANRQCQSQFSKGRWDFSYDIVTNSTPKRPTVQALEKISPGIGTEFSAVRSAIGRVHTVRIAGSGAASTNGAAACGSAAGATPSIRQIGRMIRPIPGAATNAACIAGSASNASNWLVKAAASQPSSRTSQPRPDGKAVRKAGARTRTPRSARAAGARLARTLPDRNSARARRGTARLNRLHSSTVNRPRCGIRRNRRATTAASPAKIMQNRSANSGAVSGRLKGAGHMIFMTRKLTYIVIYVKYFVIPARTMAGVFWVLTHRE